MRKFATYRRTILVLTLALLPALLLTPGSAAAETKVVAKKSPNGILGKVLLVNLRGRTLYSLSAEKNGKFICTGGCTSIWHPLVIPAGVKPKGPQGVKLGTVKRPDGRTQVRFKGRPLYTFSGDTKKGQVNGEGIKDVGTWHAAVIEKLPTPQPQPVPKPPESPYGY